MTAASLLAAFFVSLTLPRRDYPRALPTPRRSNQRGSQELLGHQLKEGRRGGWSANNWHRCLAHRWLLGFHWQVLDEDGG
jgi:hypothetical protein